MKNSHDIFLSLPIAPHNVSILKAFWADSFYAAEVDRGKRSITQLPQSPDAAHIFFQRRKFLYRSLFLFNVFQILPVAKSKLKYCSL
jgi:hypothetical protein